MFWVFLINMESKKVLRCALIGAGRMGKTHAVNLLAASAYGIPLKLEAVYDQKAENMQAFGENFGSHYCVSSVEEILENKDIEALVITSSTPSHAVLIRSALKHGKHVFCEKPGAVDIKECQELIDECAQFPNLKVMIGFNRRFDESYGQVIKKTHSGDLGEVLSFNLTSRDREEAEERFIATSGGMFKDMAIHDFDLLSHLLKADCEQVYALGGCRMVPAYGKHNDIDFGQVTFVFNNKEKEQIIGNLQLGRKNAYGYDMRLEVFGTDGMAYVNNKKVNDITYYSSSITRDQEVQGFPERFSQSYREELRAFALAVINDTNSFPTLNDAKRALVLAEACQRSLDEGRPIKKEEFIQ
mmetsp:Transcript_8541/g.9246  ORF Transcript_8541/g.9246 Transcript_8541/m.9246 type:complete len:357 (+) Transcript_8541:3-1073(+)